MSKSGHKILKARIAGDGPLRYQYNRRTGRLEKLSHKAYRPSSPRRPAPPAPTSKSQATSGAGREPGAA